MNIINKSSVVIKNEYRGYPYIVYLAVIDADNPIAKTVQMPWHYNAYVKLPENHPFYELTKKEEDIGLPISNKKYIVHNGYNDMGSIDCNGGLTFSRYFKKTSKDGFSKGAWIGWDYAHYNNNTHDYELLESLGIRNPKDKDYDDFNGYRNPLYDPTPEHVEQECCHVIDQLIDIELSERIK